MNIDASHSRFCNLERVAPNVSDNLPPKVCRLCPLLTIMITEIGKKKSPFSHDRHHKIQGFPQMCTDSEGTPHGRWRKRPPHGHTEWEKCRLWFKQTPKMDFSVIIVHRFIVHFYFWYLLALCLPREVYEEGRVWTMYVVYSETVYIL